MSLLWFSEENSCSYGGDLENFKIMLDHVKCVIGWTIMTCPIYDLIYCKVMTIIVCDMQSKDNQMQHIIWTKFNDTMVKHKYPKPNFKGFMVDSA